MADESPEVVSDIIMYSALDKTRDEIAAKVNAKHGTDLSARQVGGVINAVEEKAEAGDARQVFYRTLMRGVGAELGINFGAYLDEMLDQA